MRRTRLIAGAIVCLFSVAGCGSSGSQSGAAPAPNKPLVVDGQTIANAKLFQEARSEGTVDVYTAFPVGYPQMWQDFTKDTGIKVTGIRLTTGDLTQRVLTEAKGKKLGADIIGAMPDLGAWQQFINLGILSPETLPSSLGIPAKYKGPDSKYYITSIGVNTLAYNAQVLPSGVQITGWQSLLNPALKGKIDFLPGPNGSGGYAINYFMRAKFGTSFLQKLATQSPVLDTSTSDVTERLARGEVAVAIGRPGDLAAAKGAPIKIVFPSDGVPGAYWAMGVTSTAPDPAAAQVFLNWSMSKRGQTDLSTLVQDYPVAQGAPNPTNNGAPLPTLAQVKAYIPPLSDYLKNRTPWTNEWDQIFHYSA